LLIEFKEKSSAHPVLLLLLLHDELDDGGNDGGKLCALAAPPSHIQDASIALIKAAPDTILRPKAAPRPATPRLVIMFVPAYWTERNDPRPVAFLNLVRCRNSPRRPHNLPMKPILPLSAVATGCTLGKHRSHRRKLFLLQFGNEAWNLCERSHVHDSSMQIVTVKKFAATTAARAA
jgi:hypothetical protein